MNKILDLDPSNYETHYTQGIIFKRLKEFHLSKNSFLKSIELNPNHEKSYNEIGFLFYLEKDFKNALYYMSKSVSVNPEPSATTAPVNAPELTRFSVLPRIG